MADYITAAPAVDDSKKALSAEEKKKLLDSMGKVVLETFSEKTPKTVHSKAADLIKKVSQIRHDTLDKDKTSSIILGRRRHLMKNCNKNKKPRPSKKQVRPKPNVPTSGSKLKDTEVKEDKCATSADTVVPQPMRLTDEEILESEESIESSAYEDDEEEDADFVSVEKRTPGGEDSDEEWNDDINPSSRYWDSVSEDGGYDLTYNRKPQRITYPLKRPP